jgi:transcriptional regulator with XRE-family HTH domain
VLTLTVDGEALKRHRLAAALTQRELAAAAGVRRETVINLEAGKPARPGSIRKIATALGVDPAAISTVEAA